MGTDNTWTGEWVADRMRTVGGITSTSVLAPQIVEIVRKEYPILRVGTVAVACVDQGVVAAMLEQPHEFSFIVNVPKEAYVTGDALGLAATNSIPIGGLGDLMRAVRLSDVSEYVAPETHFIERGLKQHSRVANYKRLHDRLYAIGRWQFDSLTAVFLNAYELTADQLRTARDRYGIFDMVVVTNPNGRVTSSALNVAGGLGCKIYKWGEFLGALNRK